MIKRKTVFVLGAGASCPFGFPTGQGLRSIICGQLARGHLKSEMERLGYNDKELGQFRLEFERSAVTSIDAFLAMGPEFKEIGRRMIVAALLPFQLEARLYRADDDHPGTSDWYQYLYQLMRDDARTPDDVVANPVTFLTFNYDKSLERFFLNAIRYGFGLAQAQAQQFVRRIKIHHVYGSLDASNIDTFRYEPFRSPTEMQQMAERLMVMPSERPEVDTVCREALEAAQSVFFLGFGYDEMNCLRLGTGQVSGRVMLNQQFRVGTGLGLTSSETNVAKQRVGWSDLSILPSTCLDLLRDHVTRLIYA
jgi:hypothetical protein